MILRSIYRSTHVMKNKKTIISICIIVAILIATEYNRDKNTFTTKDASMPEFAIDYPNTW